MPPPVNVQFKGARTKRRSAAGEYFPAAPILLGHVELGKTFPARHNTRFPFANSSPLKLAHDGSG
jgi:hypothetical protein